MGGERFVALGLAQARSAWFSELARWSTSAMIPVEFVKCVTVDEVRARLASGRAFSALLIDSGTPGVDRDLIDESRASGCAVIVVDDGRHRRDWTALGASAVLPATLTRAELLDALDAHAVAISRRDVLPAADAPTAGSWRGHLVAVLGAGGVGSSTIAIALAQGLGSDVRLDGLVLLADLALDADQAMLHDVGDVMPGVQELVEAYRNGEPPSAEVRGLTFSAGERPYDLLLGLRRHRDWVTVRPRAFDAALDGVRRVYKAVVADVDPDVEGESQCGSLDVEDRNVFARAGTARADVTVVVGVPTAKGVHRMVRIVDALLEHGIDPARIVPVVNRAPRSPRSRAELTAAYGELIGARMSAARTIAGPVFVPDRRHLDDAIENGRRLPNAVTAPVTAAVQAVLGRLELRDGAAPSSPGEPVAVAPGSLGSWVEDDVG